MTDPIAYMREQIEVLPPEVANLCRSVIDASEFQAGWGSEDKHHAYRGALAWHTAEVLEIALAQAAASSIDVNPPC